MSTAIWDGMMSAVESAADEIMEYNPDAVDVDDVCDAIDEQADGLVNVYTRNCIEEWLVAGMPDAEDYGADTGGTIIQQVMQAMFFWYRDELTSRVDMLIANKSEVNDD
jgi:hypothetical protein